MNIRAQARLSPDGKQYTLNGEKMWISNAGFADLFIVFAKIDGEQFSAFLVERDTPGLTIGAEEHKLGIRGSSTCPLVLSDCAIPVGEPAGRGGQGSSHCFQHSERRPLQIRRGDPGWRAQHAAQCGSLREAAHGVWQTHHVVWADPGKDRRHRRGNLCRRSSRLSRGRRHRCGAGDARARRAGERSPEAHRGVRGRMLDREGVVLGDAGARGRPLRARSTAGTATSKSIRPSGTTATRASIASSRAPTKSTGSSLPDSC